MKKMKLKIRYLNGNRLFYAFLAGGNAVIHDQSYLNSINVFPVPDGDTGTNLASTFRAIAEGAEAKRSIKETLRSIANAALYGAQGNSGLIFAQFLHGMSKEVGHHEWMLTTKAFGESAKRAVQHAYAAIVHPVEGTMITVIREWAEAVYQKGSHTADFEELFSDSLSAAQQSLKETPLKLAVLAKANVVDAGAKGFVDFLEGILQFIKKGKLLRVQKTELDWAPPDEMKIPSKDKSLHNRFCSEALLVGTNLEIDGIRAIVQRYGDSAVVAGSEERIRIHVHTNTPDGLFFELKDCGTIAQIKVDDMKKQYEAVWAPKSKIAILTDSSCDLPRPIMDERQIHFIPLNIVFGAQQFLDKLTIMPDRFYDLLRTAKDHPKTAVPPLKTFRNTLGFLSGHYESVIAVTLSDGLSGTHGVFLKVAQDLTGRKIAVIDSKSISAGLGLLVDRASELALAGYPHDEIVRQIESWVPKSHIFVDVLTLKSFIRGGRVSAMKGLAAQIFNIKPVISIGADGKVFNAAKTFTRKGMLAKVLELIRTVTAKDKVWGYAIVHAQNPERAKVYEEALTRMLGRGPRYIMEVSPVIGVHSGIGAVAVALLSE
jgi:DegV family protein with EDD domain